MSDNRASAYQLVRDAGPVAKFEQRGQVGYLVTSHQAVDYVLKNPQYFSSQRAFEAVGSPIPMVPIAFDPPEHTRYRRILAPFFDPRSAASLLSKVRELAAHMIDTFASRGECDLVTELASPLPAEVFLALFGLPVEDRDRLIGWKDAILGLTEHEGLSPSPDAIFKAVGEPYEYLMEQITQRRESGGDDLLGQLTSGTGDEALTVEELLGLSFQFMLAGLDVVTSALSTGFAILADRPDLRSRIVADPAIIPDVIEELLRLDGPTAFVPRVATEDVELCGRVIPAGAMVHVALGAANHDPVAFPNPLEVDLGRGDRHLAFGAGPHRCLGAHLARMQMRVVLEEWHARIPDYRLSDGERPTATWPAALIGLDSLRLVFPPVSARL
jgi:cytochrome P450